MRSELWRWSTAARRHRHWLSHSARYTNFLVKQLNHIFSIRRSRPIICKNTLFLFWQTNKNSHILAVSDEDGYVSLFDTHCKLSSSSSHQENAGLVFILGFFIVVNLKLLLLAETTVIKLNEI